MQKDIRINGITLSSIGGNATSVDEDYNIDNISSNITLPLQNSFVTYDVVVHNLGNVEMGILDITGLPSNLKYSISNYNLKDCLCDDQNSSQCKLGSTTALHIKIEYQENGFDENNLDYEVNLNFDFRRLFPITYRFITNHNYPSTILEGDTLQITFVDDIPDSIMAEGVLNFTYNSPSLTIVNPVDDVVIKSVANSRYYNSLTFDGTNYVDTGFKLFDSTNNSKDFKVSFEITERNTSTKQSTIMSCMDESGSPWPGILYRILNGTQEEFQINVADNNKFGGKYGQFHSIL